MSHAHLESTLDLASPTALLQLARSYQGAQAVYAATEFEIADHLGDGAKTAEEIARTTGTHAPSLFRLLRALVAFGVLREVEPGHYALTPVCARLRADTPNSARDAVLQWGHESHWHTWRDLLHSVQTGESAVSHLFGTPNAFDYFARDPEGGAIMNAGWVATGRLAAQAIVAAYDFSASGALVDVGGGRGQVLATILRAHPTLHGILFDQPHVVVEAGPLMAQMGVAQRCMVIGGDFFAEVPPGGDTISSHA